VFAGRLFAHPSLLNIPFFLAGGLKMVYDLLLYKAFARVRTPKEAINVMFRPAERKSEIS